VSWPEVSIEDFPPERDDEPASLRQDILDELTDHFVCALNRELLKNPDQRLAKERVVNQFGDPIKIARQLWFDAMKEKMMSQRMITGFSAVMAVCSIAVVFIAWSLMKESQAVNQNMMAQLVATSKRPQPVTMVNRDQQILKQLDELKQAQRDPTKSTSEEMSQVSFQVVRNTKDKLPAVGVTGYLRKRGKQRETVSSVMSVSDETGKLDFGKLPSGQYYLDLISPWSDYYHKSDITVIPSRDYSRTIVCPAAAPEDIPIEFHVNWSDEQKSEDWYLLCDFRELKTEITPNRLELESARIIEGYAWVFGQYSQQNPRGVYLIDKNNQVSQCPLDKRGLFKDIDLKTLVKSESVNMKTGNYSLPVMYLLQKADLKNLTQLLSQFGGIIYTADVLNYERNQLVQYNRGKYIQPGVGGFLMRNDFSVPGLIDGTYSAPTTLLFPFKNKSTTTNPGDPMGLNSRSRKVNGIQFSKRLVFSAAKDTIHTWEIKLPDIENLPAPVPF